jgi:hypothetical protein
VETGAKAGRDPHPLFRSSYYARQCGPVRNPLAHWVQWGRTQLLNPHPLFDTAWYLKNTSGVGADDPLVHCYKTNSSPHPLFDSAFYLERNPEVKMNALEHYLTIGAAEGRDPHPFFNTRYYARQAGYGMNPLEHYLEIGASQGLDPDPRFDTSFYLETNMGIRMNPLVHYVLTGRANGLRTHPDFPASAPACWIDLAPVRA